MPPQSPPPLSARERQIMDVVYATGEATAADVRRRIPDAPSNSAVRTMLARLVDKGHLRQRQDGFRYLYSPALPRDSAGETALQRLLGTFFEDSPTKLVSALLSRSAGKLSARELDEIAAMIERSRGNDA